MIPNGWREVTLADIATVVGGGTPHRGESVYWDGDIPWATPSDVTTMRGRFIARTASMITKRGLVNSSASMLPTNSLLMTSRATIGVCAINRIPMATNQGFQSLIPNSTADTEFLFYLIQYQSDRLRRLATGSTFLELPKRVVQVFRIYLPPLLEQRRIAKILASVDEVIEKNKLVVNQLNVMKDGLMQNIFQRRLETFSTRWKRFKLGEIVSLEYGKSLPAKKRLAGQVLVCGSNGVIGHHIESIVAGPGIVVGRKGSAGSVTWIDREFWPIDTTFYIVKKIPSHLKWLYYAISNLNLRRLNQFTGVPGLNRNHAAELTVYVPPHLEQHKIASILSSIDEYIEEHRRMIDQIQSTKRGLMQVLLTGELRVVPDTMVP